MYKSGVILQAVQSLHAVGLAHCDLKPANVRVRISMKGRAVKVTLIDLVGTNYTGQHRYVSYLGEDPSEYLKL